MKTVGEIKGLEGKVKECECGYKVVVGVATIVVVFDALCLTERWLEVTGGVRDVEVMFVGEVMLSYRW